MFDGKLFKVDGKLWGVDGQLSDANRKACVRLVDSCATLCNVDRKLWER